MYSLPMAAEGKTRIPWGEKQEQKKVREKQEWL
jgi:hypothetical protein